MRTGTVTFSSLLKQSGEAEEDDDAEVDYYSNDSDLEESAPRSTPGGKLEPEERPAPLRPLLPASVQARTNTVATVSDTEVAVVTENDSMTSLQCGGASVKGVKHPHHAAFRIVCCVPCNVIGTVLFLVWYSH
eukprot:m.139648 g.139648  ORF g.139648 m.139648 type:complete len:133 (-) comp17634_c0_seq7:405-803(-)